MSFLEWTGAIALTVVAVYVCGAFGTIAGLMRMDENTVMAGAGAGALTGLLLSLWIVWGVDLFPFIGG